MLQDSVGSSVEMEDAAALCKVCNHAHDPAAKCPICGHIARARPLERVRAMRPTPFAFSVQSYDGEPRGKISTRTARHNAGLRVFTRLLRSRIFPQEPFDPVRAQSYRHLIAFVGEAPVGTASWQIQAEDGAPVAVVEHFGVLEDKRRRGLGRQLLQAIVEDIKATSNEWQTPVNGVAVHVPESDSILGIKMLQDGGFQMDQQPRLVNGVQCLRMFLV